MGIEVKDLQDKLKGANEDIVKLKKELDLVRSEPEERDRRKCNIVVHGLPEGDDRDDFELAVELLGAIDIQDLPKKVLRLGKPFDNPADKGRPLRIVMPNPDSKNDCVKNGPKVRKATAVSFNPKTVFVNPDYTELERRDQKKLRDELAQKRVSDPNFMIRGKRVVKRDTENPSQHASTYHSGGRGRGSFPRSPRVMHRGRGRGGVQTPPRERQLIRDPMSPPSPTRLDMSPNLSQSYPTSSQLHNIRERNMVSSPQAAASGDQGRHM